ncbi:hypothetical protein NDU88_000667 [Pleurodeles waltl]|uniref:Uncharacterized protein n=1 Tax=Pleurodeles waltl TaxID=8319 RepID=A0AAV7WI90_PLEWA|nr:hypothetical protein NDU88_000667 [Pleurodeles waltl]
MVRSGSTSWAVGRQPGLSTSTYYKQQQHGLHGAERQHKISHWTAARPGHQHMLQTAAARAAAAQDESLDGNQALPAARAAWCGAAAQDEPLDGSQASAPAHATNCTSTGCMVRSGSTRLAVGRQPGLSTSTCYKRQQHGLHGAERQHKMGCWTAARPGHQHMLQTAAARAVWCGAAAQDEPLDGSQAWAPAHATNDSSTACMVRSGSTR